MSIIHHWSKSLIYRSCVTSPGWEACRHAWEMLHYPLEEDQTRSFPLERKTGIFSMIEQTLPPQIWQTLSLEDHKIVQPCGADREIFQTAFRYLEHVHEDLFSHTSHLIQAVALVDLQEKRKEDKDVFCITSASIPDLPFCSFFSYKALLHIPPRIVISVPDIKFLAENIYHESIHHQVTLNLLENDLLQEEYHAKLSPRVPIPWREGSVARMRFWELDRVLHAFNVYVSLLPYRLKEAHAQPHSLWHTYFEQALECAQFLGQELLKYQKIFTECGQEYIREGLKTLQIYLPFQQTKALRLA